MFASDKAIFRVVPRHADVCLEDLTSQIRPEGNMPHLTGSLVCPRGCGSKIYWALSGNLWPYREEFLHFLSQQLSWTACPDHKRIQRQPPSLPERDWTYLPPAAAVVGRGARYCNCYE